MKWHKAETDIHLWLYSADHFYVAARYLYWKGLTQEFAFLGAHAIELYLKAYLIMKKGSYPEGHELIEIYEECQKYDEFFKDETLSSYFITKEDKYTNGTDWPKYIDAIKYPEPLPKHRDKKSVPYGIILGHSHVSLDQIASFVRTNIIPSRTVDYIRELLDKNYCHGELVHVCGSLNEIKEAFLRENDYFK